MHLLTKLAQLLSPLAKLSYPIYIALIAVIVYQLFFVSSPGEQQSSVAMLSLLSLVWLLLLNLIAATFNTIPSKADANSAFFKRIKVKLQRAWYFVLAFGFIALSITVAFLSIRMLRI